MITSSINLRYVFLLSMLFSNFFIKAEVAEIIVAKIETSKSFVVQKYAAVRQWAVETTAKISDQISMLIKSKKRFTNWVIEQVEKLDDDGAILPQLLFAFLAGLSVSFTPCIYPLIPITIGILSSRGRISHKRQMARSLFYVLGVAIVFAGLGVVCANLGWIAGSLSGNKWVVITSVIFYAFFALSMLDVFEIDYSIIQVKTPEVSSVFTALLYGMVTGIIASPCSTPALLSLLGFVTEKNNPQLGFILLFAFAVGMTFLVVLFSTFSHLLMLMPKPGRWMIDVRHWLGFGILFLCIDFLSSPVIISANWQKYLMLTVFWSVVFLYYFFSSKQQSVSRLIEAHRNRDIAGDSVVLERHIGFMEFISVSFFIKKLFSIIALSLAIYYGGRTYLSYNRTRLVSVIIKMLK